LAETAVHRDADEPRAAKRGQRAHAVSDGEAAERDLSIAFTGEQPAARIAHAVERGGGDIRGRNKHERTLRAASASIDTATSAVRVSYTQLGNLGTQKREHGVRVVSGVLVDCEDLERDPEVAEVLGCSPDGDANGLLIVPKRQDDGDVVPRSIGHRRKD
jgi:hypothetical protein